MTETMPTHTPVCELQLGSTDPRVYLHAIQQPIKVAWISNWGNLNRSLPEHMVHYLCAYPVIADQLNEQFTWLATLVSATESVFTTNFGFGT